MNEGTQGKPFPVFQSDEEAEQFIEEADLSEYDFSDFRRARMELVPPASVGDVTIPGTLASAARDAATRVGIPYDRFIREAIRDAVEGTKVREG